VRGLAGVHCSAIQAHVMLHSTYQHSSCWGLNLDLESLNQYPSPRPLIPQRCKTCRLTSYRDAS